MTRDKEQRFELGSLGVSHQAGASDVFVPDPGSSAWQDQGRTRTLIGQCTSKYLHCQLYSGGTAAAGLQECTRYITTLCIGTKGLSPAECTS